ncbi:MAG TPA: tetratricopeptide repeat protein [Anaerolineae bacterium]|nr:tetratricopeptide repeat protein [Anaerolineae bacterium]
MSGPNPLLTSFAGLEAASNQLVKVRFPPVRGFFSSLLGNAYLQLGDARRAIQYYEQALAIDREIGDRQGEGNWLGNLGEAYRNLGDARRAIQYYEQALAIRREIGDRRGEGGTLSLFSTSLCEIT